jgi:hypothetical protein
VSLSVLLNQITEVLTKMQQQYLRIRRFLGVFGVLLIAVGWISGCGHNNTSDVLVRVIVQNSNAQVTDGTAVLTFESDDPPKVTTFAGGFFGVQVSDSALSSGTIKAHVGKVQPQHQ